MKAGKMATWNLEIDPSTTLVIVKPNGESSAKVAYKRIQHGDLKQFEGYSKDPTVLGKTIQVEAKDGVAYSGRLFPMCTRERCESSECKQKCKASACTCPKN
jgi:hypothetical protein